MNVKSFTYQGFESDVLSQVQTYEAPKLAPVPAPAPRPMFTTEEIELAKTLAREEGMREGYDKAKNELDEKLAGVEAAEKAALDKLVENIGVQLTVMAQESTNNKHKFSERLGQLALSIARKVSGDVADKAIEAGIAEIIKESVGKLDSNDKINVYLSAKNSTALNDKFTGAAVSVDDKMEAGDFRIEWQNGFAERDVKKLWESISEICGRHSSLEEEETKQERSFANAQDDAILNASEGSKPNNITKED